MSIEKELTLKIALRLKRFLDRFSIGFCILFLIGSKYVGVFNMVLADVTANSDRPLLLFFCNV